VLDLSPRVDGFILRNNHEADNNNHSSLLSLWNLKIMKDTLRPKNLPAHVALCCDNRLPQQKSTPRLGKSRYHDHQNTAFQRLQNKIGKTKSSIFINFQQQKTVRVTETTLAKLRFHPLSIFTPIFLFLPITSPLPLSLVTHVNCPFPNSSPAH
jgi:hypothetical protein